MAEASATEPDAGGPVKEGGATPATGGLAAVRRQLAEREEQLRELRGAERSPGAVTSGLAGGLSLGMAVLWGVGGVPDTAVELAAFTALVAAALVVGTRLAWRLFGRYWRGVRLEGEIGELRRTERALGCAE